MVGPRKAETRPRGPLENIIICILAKVDQFLPRRLYARVSQLAGCPNYDNNNQPNFYHESLFNWLHIRQWPNSLLSKFNFIQFGFLKIYLPNSFTRPRPALHFISPEKALEFEPKDEIRFGESG